MAWLSRIMALVFTFTILAPTDLLAQKTFTIHDPDWTILSTDLDELTDRVQKTVGESRADPKQQLARLKEEYANAKDVFELYPILIELHRLPSASVSSLSLAEREDLLKELPQCLPDLHTLDKDAVPSQYLPDTCFINPKYEGYMMQKTKEDEKRETDEFITRITKAEESWENLMLYLDPFPGTPDKLNFSIVVAEVMGNTLDSGQLNVIETMDLLELQLRAIFRLRSLENKKQSIEAMSVEEMQTIGTLRILLLKVNQYYERTGKENPLLARRGPEGTEATWSIADGEAQIFQYFSSDLYNQIMQSFVQEINKLHAKDPKENSSAYSKMSLWTEFAVTAAILYQPKTIESIVRIFDEGPKSTKFLQNYTTALNVVFQTIREHLQFSFVASLPTDIETVGLLVSFTDPDTYSLPTRIFALESISAFIQQQPEEERQKTMEQVKQSSLAPTAPALFHRVVTIPLGTQLSVAARTVDIYASLNSADYETYGLDLSQMQMLSDKLALIYNRIANADLKLEHPDWDPVLYHDITRTKSGLSTIKNTYNEIPRLRPLNSPLMLEAWKYNGNGWGAGKRTLRTIYGAGRKSNGEWIEMSLYNGKNPHKAKNDLDMGILTFAAEVLIWVIGAEVFVLLARAYRVTRGAMLALPKATRAALHANKGRRSLSFSIEILKGSRYANLSRVLPENGITVAAARMEKVRKPITAAENAAGAGAAPANALRLAPPPASSAAFSTPSLSAAPGVSSASQQGWWGRLRTWWNKPSYTTAEELVMSPINSMRSFRNRRWWGKELAPVEEWTVSAHRPGFNFYTATLSGAKAERLRFGIRSWDDWRYLMRNARMQDGRRLSQVTAFEPLRPFSSWWSAGLKPLFGYQTFAGQIYDEKRVLGATARAFQKDAAKETGKGVFDYWKYTDSGWVRINQQEFMQLGDGLKAAGKEVVPDYYELLGISRSATQQEIKRAYKKKVLEAHPDRMGSEEWTKQLNNAYSALKNPASRAAYDAKLASSASTSSVIVLPKSPEGVSLAITRNMGEVPADFSPVSTGLGFSAENWGAVPEQLSVHLSRTGQTGVLGFSYALSQRWTGRLVENITFFGGMNLTDMWLSGPFQGYVDENIREEVERSKKQFGDAYDPKLLEEDANSIEKNLAFLEEQGMVPSDISVLSDVSAAAEPPAQGSSLGFLALGVQNSLSKTGIVQPPFRNEGVVSRLAIEANQLRINRMVRKYQESVAENNVDQLYAQVIEELEEVRKDNKKTFNLLKQQMKAGNFERENRKITQLINSCTEKVNQIYRGKGELVEKYNLILAAWEDFNVKLMQLSQEIELKINELNFNDLFTVVNQNWYYTVTALYERGYDEQQHAALFNQINQIYQSVLSDLKTLQKKGIAVNDPQVSARYNQFKREAVLLNSQIQINELENRAKEFHINISPLLNEWRAGIEEAYRSSSTLEEMQLKIWDFEMHWEEKAQQDQNWNLFQKALILSMKTDGNAQGPEETTPTETDTNELLPDETAPSSSLVY